MKVWAMQGSYHASPPVFARALNSVNCPFVRVLLSPQFGPSFFRFFQQVDKFSGGLLDIPRGQFNTVLVNGS